VLVGEHGRRIVTRRRRESARGLRADAHRDRQDDLGFRWWAVAE
jgi:hypothetical protein